MLNATEQKKAEKMYLQAQRYSAQQTIILQKAKKAGIKVSEAEVTDYIEAKALISGNGKK